jgi:predicted transcriptional regulator
MQSRDHRSAATPNSPADGCGSVTVELSAAQVDSVVRMASTGGVVSLLLAGLLRVRCALEDSRDRFDDRRLAKSLLMGLRVLSCFPADERWMSNTEVACVVGMGISTTHRYVSTLVAVGLLERDPATRQYRLWRHGGLAQSYRRPDTARVNGAIGGEDDVAPAGEGVVGIDLSPMQVQLVLKAAADAGVVSLLLSGLVAVPEVRGAALDRVVDLGLSRSLLCGLLMLSAFPVDGSRVGIGELAGSLGMHTSTAHRYIASLQVADLVERDPKTRSYRLAL